VETGPPPDKESPLNDLNMQFVREFFELNLFHVLTHWQHENVPRITDFSCLLFIERGQPALPGPVDFVLRPDELIRIQRAVVEVRAWHGDRFYPSIIEASPILGHVALPGTKELAESVLGSPEFATILVVSDLSNAPKYRSRSLELLRGYGIDHVLEFSTLLRDVLNRLSPHGNYAPSQTLQTMRLLKRYNFISNQQLEFRFPGQAFLPELSTDVDTAPPEDVESGEE